MFTAYLERVYKNRILPLRGIECSLLKWEEHILILVTNRYSYSHCMLNFDIDKRLINILYEIIEGLSFKNF